MKRAPGRAPGALAHLRLRREGNPALCRRHGDFERGIWRPAGIAYRQAGLDRGAKSPQFSLNHARLRPRAIGSLKARGAAAQHRRPGPWAQQGAVLHIDSRLRTEGKG
jgi:hypothetical protein